MNIYAQRLLNVARAIREGSEFDMSSFAHTCGTPSCAMGHYAARDDLQDDFIIAKTSPGCHPEWWPMHLETGNSDGVDSKVLAEYFGLEAYEVCELFGIWGCDHARKDAAKAIAFIEAFVARKWPIDSAVTKLESELVDAASIRETVDG